MLPTAWRVFLRGGTRSRPQSFFHTPDEVLGGNSIAILNDGRETYPAMLSAIRAARRTIHLETYILHGDETGWAFARLLAEKARAGVAVRLIYDSVGSLGLPDAMLQHMRNGGAAILEYRPVAPWRPRWGWWQRDHRKILVVDGAVAFTGGINISDVYADSPGGGPGWRDIHVRLEGPAAYELDRLFRATWFRETGRVFELAGDPERARGATAIRVAANHEFLHRHRIRRAYLHALRMAKISISITNAYFIPDRGIRRALYAACRRGVVVRVLVPEASDVPAVTYASECLFERHLREGVRLYAWPRTVLHAKAVIVDGVWVAVGSYNMDHRSWLHNLEVNLEVLDGDFGRRMEETLDRDFRASREILLDEWWRRPARRRVLERLFYLLHYWL